MATRSTYYYIPANSQYISIWKDRSKKGRRAGTIFRSKRACRYSDEDRLALPECTRLFDDMANNEKYNSPWHKWYGKGMFVFKIPPQTDQHRKNIIYVVFRTADVTVT